jgi:hypothetical protein
MVLRMSLGTMSKNEEELSEPHYYEPPLMILENIQLQILVRTEKSWLQLNSPTCLCGHIQTTTTCPSDWPKTQTLTTLHVDEDIEPLELSLVVGENAKWRSPFARQFSGFL